MHYFLDDLFDPDKTPLCVESSDVGKIFWNGLQHFCSHQPSVFRCVFPSFPYIPSHLQTHLRDIREFSCHLTPVLVAVSTAAPRLNDLLKMPATFMAPTLGKLAPVRAARNVRPVCPARAQTSPRAGRAADAPAVGDARSASASLRCVPREAAGAGGASLLLACARELAAFSGPHRPPRLVPAPRDRVAYPRKIGAHPLRLALPGRRAAPPRRRRASRSAPREAAPVSRCAHAFSSLTLFAPIFFPHAACLAPRCLAT